MKAPWLLLLTALVAAPPAGAKTWRGPAVQRLDAFLAPQAKKNVFGPVTDAVVIMVGPYVVYERYYNGYDRNTPHLSWSVSKSFTNAVVGAAVGEGKLALTDSVCRYFPGVATREHCRITLDDLLRFTSGLRWKETYENESPQLSSVLAMLYGEGSRDMAAFALSHPVAYPVGTRWEYSSGSTNVAMAMVRLALGARYDDFPWEKIFRPLGMDSVVWERDAAGTYVGSSYLHATPRDLAKFGRLFLNDGVWEGKRILPEGWVEQSVTPSQALVKDPAQGGGYVSGSSWWLNRSLGGQARPWKWAPSDAYAALGHWGQYLFVVPSLGLVVVRTGDDRQAELNADEFLRHVREAYDENLYRKTVLPGTTLALSARASQPYKTSEAELGLRFQVKELCSCLFVHGRSEADCRKYVVMPGISATLAVDASTRQVTGDLQGLTASARWLGRRDGCRLD